MSRLTMVGPHLQQDVGGPAQLKYAHGRGSSDAFVAVVLNFECSSVRQMIEKRWCMKLLCIFLFVFILTTIPFTMTEIILSAK